LTTEFIVIENAEEHLFTGLIEELGRIESMTSVGSGCDLIVRAEKVIEGTVVGDSIAINGCCLTVTSVDPGRMTFQAGSETLSRTNLGLLKVSDWVNLERALKVGERLGGHYVTGHIDAVGVIDQRNDDGQWAEFWFRVPNSLTRQMAPKGSVAVDGISLTLVNVESNRFSVALIPHTLHVTNLGQRKMSDQVNIETDVLAKYVAQQIAGIQHHLKESFQSPHHEP
jgi:riboflavin synthase